MDTEHEPNSDAAPTPRPPKVEGVKWVLQTLALPVALVALPLLYQWKASDLAEQSREASRKRDQADQQFRLYTDLMSKREESDTAVRRGLFDKLMGSYLAPTPTDVGKRLIALELLSLNFHDSLNLSPLFWELAADIDKAPSGPERDEWKSHLDRITKQVKDRQAALLEADGSRKEWDIDLAHVVDGGEQPHFSFDLPRLGEDGLPSATEKRKFEVAVVAHDPPHQRLSITVNSPGLDKTVKFWLDPYDFPLVNFSRLSGSERFAVLLYDYNSAPDVMSARIVFLYFPSSRSGAKDKPYLDDLMARLVHAEAKSDAAAPAASATK
jgi:hypothetical protein